MAAIQARYSGTCIECGGRWEPNDLIRGHAVVGGQSGYWAHDVCPDVASDFEHHAPVCETCWLSHPEGACDR